MALAFVDADVLAAPVPRSILYMAAALPNPTFTLTYSPFAENQATSHQLAKHISIGELRHRFGWDITDDPASIDKYHFIDTSDSDKTIIAAAINAKVKFIITANVKDFGEQDLFKHKMSAVHPGLFLANRISAEQYSHILTMLSKTRQREPKTPLGIHEHDVANELPQLFTRHRNLFGTPNPYQPHNPPRIDFRGYACVVPLPPPALSRRTGTIHPRTTCRG